MHVCTPCAVCSHINKASWIDHLCSWFAVHRYDHISDLDALQFEQTKLSDEKEETKNKKIKITTKNVKNDNVISFKTTKTNTQKTEQKSHYSVCGCVFCYFFYFFLFQMIFLTWRYVSHCSLALWIS